MATKGSVDDGHPEVSLGADRSRQLSSLTSEEIHKGTGKSHSIDSNDLTCRKSRGSLTFSLELPFLKRWSVGLGNKGSSERHDPREDGDDAQIPLVSSIAFNDC